MQHQEELERQRRREYAVLAIESEKASRDKEEFTRQVLVGRQAVGRY